MKLKLLFVLFLASVTVFAQENLKEREKQARFDPGYETFSRKKTAYLTYKDGKKIEGKLKKTKTKKGQIREVYFEIAEKQVEKIPASEIKELYVYPSGFEKAGKFNNVFYDVSKWGNSSLSDVVNKGYSYYTNQKVSLKNKKAEAEYLMQLVNPRFSAVMQVFHDPFASKTGSIGVGGLKLAGGIAKSYYLKKGDKIVWLHKSDFKDFFEELFMDNDKFKAKYADKKIKWSLLGVYILDYTEFSLGN